MSDFPRTPKVKKHSDVESKGGIVPRTQNQLSLELKIEKEIEINGIGMGVLSDGTAYLTGRGLARLCGIDSSRISEMGASWSSDPPSTMTVKVKELLDARGIAMDHPYIEIKQRSGIVHAYPDSVCLAVLEFYAFEAKTIRDEARKNFRILAGGALREFICTQVGYDPSHSIPDEWRQFHDRISLTYDSVPKGYYGIFKEMADIILTLGQAGLHIDHTFVPDISAGKVWGNYWTENDFDKKYGARIKFDHNYPEYFPQSESNPQLSWCYPESSLGAFRQWMREIYIGEGKLKNYITQKVKQKELPASFAQLAIAAYEEPKRIETKPS